MARLLVNQGWPGQIAAATIGYSTALGVSYLFHRLGHHQIERGTTWFMVGAEAPQRHA